MPLAILLGLVAARYDGRWPDKLISGVTLTTISLPEFVAAYFVIYLLTQVIPIFQPVAMVFPGMSFWAKLNAVALPVIVLVLVVLAHMMRMTRAAILNVMQSAYIETAELKGLSPMTVIWRHAFPNAIAPVVSVVMLNLAYLVVGVVVVEVVFSYNALGQYLVDHVTKRDLPVVQAVGLIFAAVYIVSEHAGRHHRHPGQPAPEAPEMRIPLSALIGLILTGAFVFVAVFAQWIAPYPHRPVGRQGLGGAFGRHTGWAPIPSAATSFRG